MDEEAPVAPMRERGRLPAHGGSTYEYVMQYSIINSKITTPMVNAI